MRKLITANFHRFSKDRFSWCVLGIVVILSLGNVFNSVGSFETMAASGYAVSLDEYYFNQAPLIGAFLALLISMFLGTEFSEGTIRNKLCIGHKRDEIFLSNFISCAFASIVLTVVWLSFYAVMQEKGIQPEIKLPEEPVFRELDTGAINRIFSNIISNALKYSDGDLSVVMDKNRCVTFSNTAHNLNAVTVGRLFDRFYTVESSRNSTGLGLSIAKLLIERMGGTISAQYAEHKLNIVIKM